MGELRTLLKREESYGIHALLAVAESPGIGAAEIAARLQVPPAFLAKVLSKLVKAGFVESRMGRGGGVWLRTDPGAISFLGVMEALSGPVVMDTCQTQPQCATQRRKGSCALKPIWLEGSLRVRELLAGYTLAQLLPRPAGAQEP